MRTNQIDPNLLSALEPSKVESLDMPHVQSYNKLVRELAPNQKGITQDEFIRLYSLNSHLEPIAYDGDALVSRVAFLFLNPNFGDDATRESHFRRDPEYRLAALSPRATVGTQKYYREIVFKRLLEHYDAKYLAARCLKIELCPWASRKFPTQGKLVRALQAFPSRALTTKLVEQIAASGVVIAIMKGVGHWPKEVPILQAITGSQAFKNSAPIGNYVTPNTVGEMGWQTILDALNSEPSTLPC